MAKPQPVSNGMNNKIKYATYLALGTALISGFSNFLAKIAVTAVKDPIVFTTLKNGVVGLLLIGLIIGMKKWPEIKRLTRNQWLKLGAVGIVGGFIPFALFFTGLSKTSAINASLIHKTLFVWVLLLAIPLLKEKVSKGLLAGMALIFGANLLVGGFQGFKFNTAELMILGATILWAVENIVAKKALRNLSSLTVASARMVFGSVMLLGLIAWQGNLSMLSGLNGTQWMWTLMASALLSGYVLTWYTALKYAPVSYVATLLVPATLVTNVLSAIFITHSLTGLMVMSGLLYTAGTALVIYFARKSEPSLSPVLN